MIWVFIFFVMVGLSESILSNQKIKFNSDIETYKICTLIIGDLENEKLISEVREKNCNVIKSEDEFQILEIIKSLSKNSKVYFVTSKEIEDKTLIMNILKESLDKNIKLFIFYKPERYESITNLKTISFATGGEFFDLSDTYIKTNYEHVVKNKTVFGYYKLKFDISDSTNLIFIEVKGEIEDLEIITPFGQKINFTNNMIAFKISFKDICFVTLKVNQNGPWTLSFDAKKRAYVNIIKEDALEQIFIQDQARFRRLVTAEKIQTVPSVSIDVGSSSQLLATPNTYITVFFEVTNNEKETISVGFTCSDTKYLLQTMNPGSATISPNQTITVTVYLNTAISSGNMDTITFQVTGKISTVRKMAYLYINDIQDTETNPPELWYSLINDCLKVDSSDCQSATWSVDIFAKDTETGLLRLESQPRGIYFDNDNFASGSKDEIAGHYVGSCCNSKLTVTATDLKGNRNTLEINPYESGPLSAGFVSAIVLGVILLIVVIIIIIYFIIRQKQKASLDLPVYKGPSGSRTPL